MHDLWISNVPSYFPVTDAFGNCWGKKNATLNSRVVPLKIAVVKRKRTVMPFDRAIVDVKDNISYVIFKYTVFYDLFAASQITIKEHDRQMPFYLHGARQISNKREARVNILNIYIHYSSNASLFHKFTGQGRSSRSYKSNVDKLGTLGVHVRPTRWSWAVLCNM